MLSDHPHTVQRRRRTAVPSSHLRTLQRRTAEPSARPRTSSQSPLVLPSPVVDPSPSPPLVSLPSQSPLPEISVLSSRPVSESEIVIVPTDPSYFTVIETHLNLAHRCEDMLGKITPKNANAFFAGNLVGQAVRFVNSNRYIFTVSMPGKGLVLVHQHAIDESDSVCNDRVFRRIFAFFDAIGREVMLQPSNERKEVPAIAQSDVPAIAQSDVPVITQFDVPVIAESDLQIITQPYMLVIAESNVPVVAEPDVQDIAQPAESDDTEISRAASGMFMSITDSGGSIITQSYGSTCESRCSLANEISSHDGAAKKVQKKMKMVSGEEGKKKAVAHAPRRRSPRLAEQRIQVKDDDVSKEISTGRTKSRLVEEARPQRIG